MRGRSKAFSKHCEGPDGSGTCPEFAEGRVAQQGGRYRALTDLFQCEPCYRAWCRDGGWHGEEAQAVTGGPGALEAARPSRYPWDDAPEAHDE